jgi:hypothetical protein
VNFCHKYLEAYVTAINEQPIFHVNDIMTILDEFRALHEPSMHINLSLAPKHLHDSSDHGPPPLHLCHDDIMHINHLHTDGMTPEDSVNLPIINSRNYQTGPFGMRLLMPNSMHIFMVV